jgi:CRP/FNR family transcriptional regulator, cyclic AMP receptor protein
MERPVDEGSQFGGNSAAVHAPAHGGVARRPSLADLEKVWMLQGVPADLLAELAEKCEERIYTPGETIFLEGDASDGLYLIVSGAVRIIAHVENGERNLATVGEGECFGEMGVIDASPRSAAAVTATMACVCFVPTEPFLDLMERASIVPMKMLALLSGRLRRTNRYTADLPGDTLTRVSEQLEP